MKVLKPKGIQHFFLFTGGAVETKDRHIQTKKYTVIWTVKSIIDESNKIKKVVGGENADK